LRLSRLTKQFVPHNLDEMTERRMCHAENVRESPIESFTEICCSGPIVRPLVYKASIFFLK
jgi:hypothetical protein